jgi:predicted nucleotidyltransferase
VTTRADFLQSRCALRERFVERLIDVTQREGAAEAHLFGSMARGDDDALSDVDFWATFPDARIDVVVRMRHALLSVIGELFHTHEALPNRPLGGSYTLALYRTEHWPLHLDFYAAPISTSRIVPGSRILFEDVAVARGEWLLDVDAVQDRAPAERVDWFIAMFVVAVKKIARGDGRAFRSFLAQRFTDFLQQNMPRLRSLELDHFASYGEIRAALITLATLADARQRKAIDEVQEYVSRVTSGEFDI